MNKVKIVRALLKSLNNGATVTSACKAAGIAQSTYFLWMSKDKKFAKMTERAISSRVHIVEDALFKTAVTGAVSAQKYFLNNRASNKWRDEQPVIMNIEHKTAIFQQIHNNYAANGNGKLEHDGDSRKSKDNTRGRLKVIK